MGAVGIDPLESFIDTLPGEHIWNPGEQGKVCI